jgi:hypothetical protein
VKMVVSNPRSFARVWLGTTPSPEIMLQNPFWEDREGSQTGSARPGVTSHFHLWNLGFQDGVPTPSSPHPQLWGYKMGSPPPPHPTPSSGPRGRLQGSGGGLCTQSQTWGVQRGKVENAQFVQREPAIGTAQVPGGGGENQETGRHSRGDSLLQADERRRAPERLRATTAPHPHTPHSLFRPRFGRTV